MTSAAINNHEIQVQFPLNLRFDEYLEPNSPKRSLVLLHGYGETKERMQRKLGQYLRGFARQTIVLNAPFPAPQLSKDGYKEGYAWYFRSQSLNLTMIAPETCNYFFDALIDRCHLNENPVTMIGFSQGGFIMPYLGSKLKNLEQMIGISCGAHELGALFKTQPKLNIIHSTEDKIFDVNQAKQQFELLKLDAKESQFRLIPGGHDIDSAKVDEVKKLL